MYKDLYDYVIIVVIGVIIAALVFYFFANKKEGRVSAGFYLLVLLAGAALYFLAIKFNNDEKVTFSIFILIFSSLSYSIMAFIGYFNENSILSDLAANNPVFEFAIILHFCTALYFTYLAISITSFGKKVKNGIRVWLTSFCDKYIVIGYDRQAKMFLNKLQRQRTTVIINSNQVDEKLDLLNKGFAVVTVKEEQEEKKENNYSYKSYEKALKTAGAMKCSFKTKRIISMSEQDEINILIAKIMRDFIVKKTPQLKIEENDNDKIKEKKKEKYENKTDKIKLYVRIMYSFLERAEHYKFTENTLGKLRFFNPYKIKAYKFWSEYPITKLIPFNWIDTGKARLKENVNSPEGKYKISTIFIGFGSTNKALLKTSIINNQLLNVDYNALVLCKDAEMYKKMFRNSAIGLFDETDQNGNIIKRGAELKPNLKENDYLENPSERNSIVFKEADAYTVELYDIIIKELQGKVSENGKNYILPCDYASVIIALGDDKLSMETALELRQKLYEADLLTSNDGEKEYQRVKIFVKLNKNSILADKELINSDLKNIKCEIIPCGANEEILTEDYIINEKLDILARNIANRYEGNAEKHLSASEWNTCSQFKRESNRYAAMAIRIKLNLLGFNLIECSKPNPLYIHEFRKKYGTDFGFNLRVERIKLNNKIKQARKEEKEGKTIPENLKDLKIEDEIIDLAERMNDDFADTPRNNLAKLEHQRWNAFHLANDWTKLLKDKICAGRSGRQNEIAKQHACITTFNGLINLRNIQKEAEKAELEDSKKKQYIEAESLLKADTIRHDFNTMDFLVDLSEDNLKKMREAERNSKKKYKGILTDSGYCIGEFKNS